MKKCLFGGAMFAAGIAAQANAQQFNIEVGPYGIAALAYSYQFSYNTYASDYQLAYGAFVPQYATTTLDGVTGTAMVTNTTIASSASGQTPGQPNDQFNLAYAYFNVDPGVTLDIEWDFSALSVSPFFGFGGVIQVLNLDSGIVEFAVDQALGDPLTGSMNFDPVDGASYRAAVNVGGFFTGGEASASITTVPTPAGATLLAMGGFMAARRRR